MSSGGTAPSDLSSLRVLIVHEWLVTWAGSERCVEQLLVLFPQADLVVGVMRPEMRDLNDVTRRARESWLGRVPGARRHHRWFLLLYPLAFASVDTRAYDLVISSSHAFAKCVRTHGRTKHLCYCYSPPRYLWDLFEAHQEEGGLGAVALRLFAPLLRWVDRRAAARVHRFVGISRYIAERIKRAYGVEAAVVYPPVSAKPAAEQGTVPRRGLLSLGRLVPYKRVDLAIHASNALGLELTVAGSGPERPRLEALAGPTVHFVGEVSEEDAGALMERSQLLVFCAEEDFGIAPLEANAHGLPVVAYRRGGAAETLIDGLTAQFFDDLSPSGVIAAIGAARTHEWTDHALRENSARFSAACFLDGVARESRALLALD